MGRTHEAMRLDTAQWVIMVARERFQDGNKEGSLEWIESAIEDLIKIRDQFREELQSACEECNISDGSGNGEGIPVSITEPQELCKGASPSERELSKAT